MHSLWIPSGAAIRLRNRILPSCTPFSSSTCTHRSARDVSASDERADAAPTPSTLEQAIEDVWTTSGKGHTQERAALVPLHEFNAAIGHVCDRLMGTAPARRASMAREAELPVARMGSMSSTCRAAMSCGSFSYTSS